MNRREVVHKFLIGGTVLVLAPKILESCTKSAMDTMTNPGGTTPVTSFDLDLSLTENAGLNTPGSSKIVHNIIIINVANTFVALSSICTHQGCTVAYNPGAGDLECPCHGSVYNIAGNVLVGPAPSPLRAYTISKTGSVLTISL